MIRSGASAGDADEIAQDVMVAIWRRAGTFDPERAAASTWIFAIARHRRIDLIRRAGRAGPDPLDPLFQPEAEPDAFAALERRRARGSGCARRSPRCRPSSGRCWSPPSTRG